MIGTTAVSPVRWLNPGMLNYVQTAGTGGTVNSGTDYYAILSLSNPADSVKIRFDNATSGTRTVSWNGSQWLSYGGNVRMKVLVISSSGTVGVAEAANAPLEFALAQNYPNPFNPSTRIAYTIPRRGLVHLTVFDVLGKEVARLVNQEEPAGHHEVSWNGQTSAGLPVASGVYFYRLESAGMTKSAKMMLLK